MGAEQSKPTAAERAVVERLRALELEKRQAVNEDGYVELDSADSNGYTNEKTLEALRRSPTTLDVSQLEDWQSKLLEDPKNRCFMTPSYNSLLSAVHLNTHVIS